ncbi:integral membrane [Trichoderma arundinaceum]|uniref:Integral membrane n=1 Tax=Trichoderma arundinaceum TaxID=490622 RepID=A0A395N9R6_TRIAR|nr:integral membrane [Trichoderma arundinaceum]
MALQAVTFPIDPTVKIHLITNCVLVFIAIFIVGLRLYARFTSGAKLWWDDYLILLSMPQGVGMLIIQGLYSPMGVGRPITETLPNLIIILKLTISYALIYTACISTVKLSVLFFYLRVFPNQQMRIATQIVIGFVSIWAVANVLMFFLICRPFEANYNPAIGGTCGNQVSAFIAVGAYNIISDFVVLTLPLHTIWTLKARRQMKISLSAIFLAGLIVSAVAVCRIITLTHLELANITGTMVWVDFLSTLEVNLGIICVSLPMLRPLVSRYNNTRGASKIGQYQSERSGQSGSKLSSRKRQPGLDTIALHSIYDNTGDMSHGATGFAVEASSPDGSETHLSPPQHASSALDRPGANAILVESKWEIQHS